jgi:hypothetical protein
VTPITDSRHVGTQAPADDLPVEKLDEHCRKQPAFVGGDIVTSATQILSRLN